MSERPSRAAALRACPVPALAPATDARDATAAVRGERLHDLDAMRSVLMLLGIVLHAINPYGLDGSWLVADRARSEVLETIAVSIHLFRMPAFFVVSGYFSMLLLRRRPRPEFLRERLRRTLLPMLAVLLSFNLAQVWFLGPRAPADGFVRGVLLPALHDGQWLGHLWFLLYLALYCLALAALRPRLLAFADGPWPARLARPRAFAALLGIAALVPLGNAVAAHALPLLAQQVAGLVNPEELLDHAPFFAVGCLLQANAVLLRRFSSVGAAQWLVGGAALLALSLLPERGGIAATAMAIVARALLAWCLVRLVFAAFARWARGPSATFRYLSDASYSMYLFHHLCVVVVATALLPLPWAAPAKFAVVLACAALLPLAMHHFLVRPYAPMRWLFNGKPLPAAATAS